MQKNSKILVISITLLIVAIGGVLFLVNFYSTDDTSTRILVSSDENRNTFNKIFLTPPCTHNKEVFYFQEKGNELVTYTNPERGLTFQVPYNPKWGAPDFRVQPYDQIGDGINFGTIYIFGCDAWTRAYNLKFTPAETKESVIARLEKEYSDSENFEIYSYNINGKTVIQYSKEESYETGKTIVIGKKHNYILRYNGTVNLPKLGTKLFVFGTNIPTQIEDIIKSMQFID